MQMTKKQQLKIWIKLGKFRVANLARKLGSTRQYIDHICTIKNGLSDEQFQLIKQAMVLVELDEKRHKTSIESNIIKAAYLSHQGETEAIRNFALIQLDHWVAALGDMPVACKQIIPPAKESSWEF